MKYAHPYCTYAHMNFDGRILYIGKGRIHRATEFAPSRRSKYHLNSIKKHCPDFVLVVAQPYATEEEAFSREREWIAEARAAGHKLCNFTDGGEGASGRKKTPEEREHLRQLALRQWDTRGRKPKVPAIGGECQCLECGATIVLKYIKVPRKVCSKRCESRRFRRLKAEAAQSADEH